MQPEGSVLETLTSVGAQESATVMALRCSVVDSLGTTRTFKCFWRAPHRPCRENENCTRREQDRTDFLVVGDHRGGENHQDSQDNEDPRDKSWNRMHRGLCTNAICCLQLFSSKQPPTDDDHQKSRTHRE